MLLPWVSPWQDRWIIFGALLSKCTKFCYVATAHLKAMPLPDSLAAALMVFASVKNWSYGKIK